MRCTPLQFSRCTRVAARCSVAARCTMHHREYSLRVPKGRVLFCNDPARGRRYRTQVAVTVADSGVDEKINAGLNPAR